MVLHEDLKCNPMTRCSMAHLVCLKPYSIIVIVLMGILSYDLNMFI